MAEVFSRIRDEEISQWCVLAVLKLPPCDLADVDTKGLGAGWVIEEAQVSWLQQTVDLIVPGEGRDVPSVLQHVAPDFGVAMVHIQDRGIVQVAKLYRGLSIPKLAESISTTALS